MFGNYSRHVINNLEADRIIRRREEQARVEKAIAEEHARAVAARLEREAAEAETKPAE